MSDKDQKLRHGLQLGVATACSPETMRPFNVDVRVRDNMPNFLNGPTTIGRECNSAVCNSSEDDTAT